MKTSWVISRNEWKDGFFARKSPTEKAKVRITIVVTDQQSKVIDSYCQKEGISYNLLIREALSEFFDSRGHDVTPDQAEDSNQLKMFQE